MHKIKLSYLLNTGFIYLLFFVLILSIFENKKKVKVYAVMNRY